MPRHFLESYSVQNKPEAEKAAVRKERLTGQEGITKDSAEKIQAYIERLENVFLNPNEEIRTRNLEMLKPKIYEKTVIKSENFPESYFTYQKEQMKARGIDVSDLRFSEEDKQKEIVNVQESQRKSLDAWMEYLTGDDCYYPADIKFFAMQGVLKIGSVNEKDYSFIGRKPDTTATFPNIDHEALAEVLGSLEQFHHNKDEVNIDPELLALIKNNKSFGEMYLKTMQLLDQRAGDKPLTITEGKWRVFAQNSDPNELVKALEGKRSNICIANIGNASGYLKRGAVEIYFSNDREGNPTIPRIALANTDNKLYEVRGTFDKDENMDPWIEKSGILTERVKTMENGEKFAKKDADMKQLTQIYEKCFKVNKKTGEKTYLNNELSKSELAFLYEIDSKIEGFGYQTDPRIKELRDQRDKNADMLVIFECQPNQIIHNQKELNQALKDQIAIKAFVGELFLNIFKLLPSNLEQIYTEFPEGKIKQKTIELGTGLKTKDDFVKALEQEKVQVSNWSKDIMGKPEFTVAKEKIEENLVILTVASLGFISGATVQEIYNRAHELGLELCPPETGPQLRLQYLDQPNGEYIAIAMKPITDSDGHLGLFDVDRNRSLPWLDANDGSPDRRYDGGYPFAFALRFASKT